jgi:hypothetical protein
MIQSVRSQVQARYAFIDRGGGGLVASDFQRSISEGTPVRYTRHELKQDKLATTAAEAVQEVVQHRSGIVQIVAIVVALALVGGGIWWYIPRTDGNERTGTGTGVV